MHRAIVVLVILLAVSLSFGFADKRKAKPKAKPPTKKSTAKKSTANKSTAKKATARTAKRRTAKAPPKPRIVAHSIPVSIFSSDEMICGSGQCPMRVSSAKLVANSTNPGVDEQSKFEWSVTVGKLTSVGNVLSWDLKGVVPGVYTATVKVSDQHAGTGSAQQQVTVVDCGPCSQNSSPCPVISVSCPDEIDPSASLKFLTTVSGGSLLSTPITYLWTVSSGKIVNGEKSKDLEVALPSDEEEIRGTVFVGGFDPRCATIASCTSKIKKQR
jgi:hypothetical protein